MNSGRRNVEYKRKRGEKNRSRMRERENDRGKTREEPKRTGEYEKGPIRVTSRETKDEWYREKARKWRERNERRSTSGQIYSRLCGTFWRCGWTAVVEGGKARRIPRERGSLLSRSSSRRRTFHPLCVYVYTRPVSERARGSERGLWGGWKVGGRRPIEG